MRNRSMRHGMWLAMALSAAMNAAWAQRDSGLPEDSGAALVNYSALGYQDSFDQFIVKFREQAQAEQGGDTRAAVIQRASQAVGRTLNLGRRLAVGSDLVRVEGGKITRKQAYSLMQALAQFPEVEAVEPDARMHILMTPNDSGYTQQ